MTSFRDQLVTIRIRRGAVQAAIEALKKLCVARHRRAPRSTNDAEQRRLADEADLYAEEFHAALQSADEEAP